MQEDTPNREDTVVERFRRRYQYGMAQSVEDRKQRALDMAALSEVGPWDPLELQQRQDKRNPRPTPHHDIIRQYGLSIVNEQRMNPRSVKLVGRGDGATEETVALRSARMRAIEQRSRARDAFINALQNAVDGGYGYLRLDVKPVSPTSANLEICVDVIQNPDAVVDDPDTQKLDNSDRNWLILVQQVTDDELRAKFPKMQSIESFTPEDITIVRRMFGEVKYLCEFWERKCTSERVWFLGDSPEGQFESDLKSAGYEVKGDFLLGPDGEFASERSRKSERYSITKYLTNGLEILEEEPWPGSIIPFPSVFGPSKWMNGVRTRESVTRFLRQPQMAFDLARGSEQEQLAIVPKVKWVMSALAMRGYEKMWDIAHRSPLAYLLVNERDNDGRELRPPQYQAHEPQVQAVEMAASSYMRDAANAAGMAPAERVDRVARSGLAQQELRAQGQLTQYHFVDAYERAIEMAGRIANELLDVIEDSERTVGMVSPTGEYRTHNLQVAEMDGTVMSEYGDGRAHDVVIETGPSYSSQRSEAVDVLRRLGETEGVGPAVAPMLVKFMNLGPDGEKLYNVLLAALPEPIQAAYRDEKTGRDIPPEFVAKMQELQEQLKAMDAYGKQLEARLIEADEKVQSQQLLVESKERIASQDNETKIVLEQMKQEHELQLKRIDLQMQELKARLDAKAEVEAILGERSE